MKKYWTFFWGALFFVPEIIHAIDNKPGGTMSEWIWDVFAVRIPNPEWAFLRRFILGGMLWALMFHFLFNMSSVPVILFGAGCAWCVYFHMRYEG